MVTKVLKATKSKSIRSTFNEISYNNKLVILNSYLSKIGYIEQFIYPKLVILNSLFVQNWIY